MFYENNEKKTVLGKTLFEPMVFYGEDPKSSTLIEPMIFYEDTPETPMLVEPMIFDEIKLKENESVAYSNNSVEAQSNDNVNPLSWIKQQLNNDNNIFYQTKTGDSSQLDACTHVAIPEPSQAQNKSIVGPKATAFEAMKRFLSLQPTINYQEKFYTYNGVFYQETSIENINRMICNHCAAYVAASGSPKYVDYISDFIKKNPNITKTESDISLRTIAFQNGVFDIHKRCLLPPSHKNYNLYAVTANYSNRIVPTPVFDRFLFDITGIPKNFV